ARRPRGRLPAARPERAPRRVSARAGDARADPSPRRAETSEHRADRTPARNEREGQLGDVHLGRAPTTSASSGGGAHSVQRPYRGGRIGSLDPPRDPAEEEGGGSTRGARPRPTNTPHAPAVTQRRPHSSAPRAPV